MTGRPGENLTISEEKAARLFMRAAELDSAAGSSLSLKQVRQIAIEAGISPRSVDTALDELLSHTSRVDPSRVNEDRSPATYAPAWVRFCMFGVPDRRFATGYYWLFFAGLIAFPIWALLRGATESGFAALLPALGGMAFCTFALWSTSRTIRWLDEHGWDALHK